MNTGTGYPVVNMNGASRESLVEARCKAAEALRVAMEALSACHPHGRDYQTAAPGEYEIARARHAARFGFLDKLYNELMDEAVAISK